MLVCTWAGSLREVEGDETGGGVQQHDVAHRAGLPREHASGRRAALCAASPPSRSSDLRAREAEVARVEVVLGHRAARHLPDVAVAGRGQLVEAVVAAEHQSRRAAGLEDADEERNPLEAGDADGGGLGAGRVAERAEDS